MMEFGKWTYLVLLLVSVAYPLAQSFERRVYMHRKFRFMIPGILLLSAIYLVWDVIFAHQGIWGFSKELTLDLYIAGLPLEEWLFFFIIPWCCLFIHEVLRYFVKRFYFPGAARIILLVLLITFLTLIPFHLQHTYTLVTMSFSAVMIAWALLTKSARHWLSGFLLSYAISLIPFFLVNGVLTSLPVVWYNDAQNMGIRLWTIPLEDSIYLLGLLLPIHLIYHALLERRASPQLRMDMGLDEPSGF